MGQIHHDWEYDAKRNVLVLVKPLPGGYGYPVCYMKDEDVEIPCSEECRTAFKDGSVLEEGKDYEIKSWAVKDAMFPFESRIMAYPIKQDNTNEDEQLESWRDIWEIGQRIRDKSNMIDAWTEKYTITKRKP